MSEPIQVLMVEDDADDAELLIHRLRREGFALSLEASGERRGA